MKLYYHAFRKRIYDENKKETLFFVSKRFLKYKIFDKNKKIVAIINRKNFSNDCTINVNQISMIGKYDYNSNSINFINENIEIVGGKCRCAINKDNKLISVMQIEPPYHTWFQDYMSIEIFDEQNISLILALLIPTLIVLYMNDDGYNGG